MVLPALPGNAVGEFPGDHRIYASGSYGYCQIGDRLFAIKLDEVESRWSEVPLEGVVDLEPNDSGQLSVRCKEEERAVFYRISGTSVEQIAERATFDSGVWYADAIGRVWLQADGKEGTDSSPRLIVLKADEEERVITSKPSKYGNRRRRPCEYLPGNLVLYFNTSVIHATPDRVDVRRPASFASDGTGSGPIRLGRDLLSGGSNKPGSFLVSPRTPERIKIRLGLGWSWLKPVATAPDGRALVMAQTDRNPQFTLFWYAANARSQQRLVGADDVLRAGFKEQVTSQFGGSRAPVFFDERGLGYARVRDGWLAVFDKNSARLVTPKTGLPVKKLVDLALTGDKLLMLGSDGRVVLWDTQHQLSRPTPEDYLKGPEWSVVGPCCIDREGDLWTFLAEFPGKISSYDGASWRHRPIDLGTRRPRLLTTDDIGSIQVSYGSAPDGTDLITPDGVESWYSQSKGWDNDYKRAWKRSLQLGATHFFDGSAERTPHWTDGERIWFFNGRTLWDGVIEADYHGRPEYDRWWVEPDGTWFRQHRGRNPATISRYTDGSWKVDSDSPCLQLLGSRGIQGYTWNELRQKPDRYATVTWLPRGEPVAHASDAYYPESIKRGEVVRAVGLKGDELYLPTDDGAAWVGKWRLRHGLFIDLKMKGTVYEGKSGRFLLNPNEKLLSALPRRDLSVTADAEQTETGWTIKPVVIGATEDDPVRFAVSVNGEPRPQLSNGPSLSFEKKYANCEIVIAAVDQYGNVSTNQAKIRLDSDHESKGVAETPPQWTVFSDRLVISGVEYKPRGRGLAVRGDGIVFVTASSKQSRASQLLAYEPHLDRWRRVPTALRSNGRDRPQEVGIDRLASTPDGQVYAIGSAAGDRVSDRTVRGVYRVGLSGIQRITHASVEPRNHAGLAWDSLGGLWEIGPRSAARYDAGRWKRWELPLGAGARIVTSHTGHVALLARGRYWIYRRGELSDTQEFADGWEAEPNGVWLGAHHLMVFAKRPKGDRITEQRWMIVDVEEGTVRESSIRPASSVRLGREGDLYLQRVGKPLELLSGVTRTASPTPLRLDSRGMMSLGLHLRPDLLVTQNDIVVLRQDNGDVSVWPQAGGKVETFGWRQGLSSGVTLAMTEDKEGCVWILTDSQLLRFNPGAAAGEAEERFEGWDELAISHACPGVDRSLWFVGEDRAEAHKHTGTSKASWALPEQSRRGRPRIAAVSDTGEAVVCYGSYDAPSVLLRPDGGVELVKSFYAAVKMIIDRGAKEFAAEEAPPVITQDGIIYCRGRVFVEGEWKPTREGRASLGSDGVLTLATNVGILARGAPYFYRWKDDRWLDVGEQDRYLLDAYGARAFDPELLREMPDRFLVADRIGNGRYRLVSGRGKKPFELVKDPCSVTPLGDERFLARSRGSAQHYLVSGSDAAILTEASLPFGRSSGTVVQLSDRRWAWILGNRVFISPSGFSFTPVSEKPMIESRNSGPGPVEIVIPTTR